jgi:hypothetical protein
MGKKKDKFECSKPETIYGIIFCKYEVKILRTYQLKSRIKNMLFIICFEDIKIQAKIFRRGFVGCLGGFVDGPLWNRRSLRRFRRIFFNFIFECKIKILIFQNF